MKKIIFVFLLCIFIMILVECRVSYKPPLLPVRISIDNDLNVSISGEVSLITPLGKFSIGAPYKLITNNGIIVVIRNKNIDEDQIFELNTDDEVEVITNGETKILAKNKKVIIDITNGEIKSVEFRKANNPRFPQKAFWKPFAFGYKPFALFSWGYDDSTIEKGILGFLWFLLRFIFALILLLFDLLIMIILGIGVLLHSFFNETVRNIFFGIVGLYFLIIVIAALYEIFVDY